MGEQWPNWIISSLADRHHFQTYFLSSFGLRAAEVPVLMMSQIWFFVWSCAIFACVFFGTHGDPNEMTAFFEVAVFVLHSFCCISHQHTGAMYYFVVHVSIVSNSTVCTTKNWYIPYYLSHPSLKKEQSLLSISFFYWHLTPETSVILYLLAMSVHLQRHVPYCDLLLYFQ